ncbi:MAG: MIP/aquaporin family protein [Acidimicrobiales bacterium]
MVKPESPCGDPPRRRPQGTSSGDTLTSEEAVDTPPGRQANPPSPSLMRRCFAEAAGTALLVAVGLSIVILDFGHASPVAAVIKSIAERRALTGFLFGATGMTVALSPLGRWSGAHINPVVTVAFVGEGTLPIREAAAYVASQSVGAVAGSVPLLLWSHMGSSVAYGATYPGSAGMAAAFLGEVVTTFVLITALLNFVSRPKVRRFTPLIFPPMYAVMVWLEAGYSGTSTNPARSLGPDLVGLDFRAYWLYVAAPVVGTGVALVVRRFAPVLRDLEVDVARVAHFETVRLDTVVSPVSKFRQNQDVT